VKGKKEMEDIKIVAKGMIVGLIAIVIIGSISYGLELYTGADIYLKEGTIYKKEVINGELRERAYGNMAYIPTRYRIHICDEVEKRGRIYEKKNFFDVTEETYSCYEVGDWFDSQNPAGDRMSENGEEDVRISQ
jgi:hypothetical protein